jgi:hypothetical protein
MPQPPSPRHLPPIALAALERPQLERLAQHLNQLLSRVVRAVRDNAKPEWKVSIAVQEVLDGPGSVMLDRPLVRALEDERQAQIADVNEVRWSRWREPSGGGVTNVRQSDK